MMSKDLTALLERLEAATGSDPGLDHELAQTLQSEQVDYTASVDRCVEMLRTLLPGWSWHVGWGANGIMPYAAVHNGHRRSAATAPTVPLALLTAMLRARIEDRDAA